MGVSRLKAFFGQFEYRELGPWTLGQALVYARRIQTMNLGPPAFVCPNCGTEVNHAPLPATCPACKQPLENVSVGPVDVPLREPDPRQTHQPAGDRRQHRKVDRRRHGPR